MRFNLVASLTKIKASLQQIKFLRTRFDWASVLTTSVILEALSSFCHRALSKLAWHKKLDCGFHVLWGESLLISVDHEQAAFRHYFFESFGHNRVHREHSLLGDANLLFVAADLLQDPENVGIESVCVTTILRLLLGCGFLLLKKLCHGWTDVDLLLLSMDHSCKKS